MSYQIVNLNPELRVSGEGWVRLGGTMLPQGEITLRAYGSPLGGSIQVRLVAADSGTPLVQISSASNVPELFGPSPAIPLGEDSHVFIEGRTVEPGASGWIHWLAIDQILETNEAGALTEEAYVYQTVNFDQNLTINGNGWQQIGAVFLPESPVNIRAYGVAISGEIQIRLADPANNSSMTMVTGSNREWGLIGPSSDFSAEEKLYTVHARMGGIGDAGRVAWLAISQSFSQVAGAGKGYLGPNYRSWLPLNHSADNYAQYLNRMQILMHLNWIAARTLESLGFPSEGRVYNEARVWEHVGVRHMPAICVVWSPSQESDDRFSTFEYERARYSIMLHANGMSTMDKYLLITEMYSSFMHLVYSDSTLGGWAVEAKKESSLVSDEAVYNPRGEAQSASLGSFDIGASWSPGHFDGNTMKIISAHLPTPNTQALQADVYADLLPALVASQLQNFSLTEANGAQYQNSRDHVFSVRGSISFTTPSAALVGLRLTRNDEPLEDGQGEVVHSTNAGSTVTLPINALVGLTKGVVLKLQLVSSISQQIVVAKMTIAASPVNQF
jgi:hypothetical protein